MASTREDFSKDQFRRDYLIHGPDNLLVQIPHLSKLSDLYMKRARVNKDPERNWLNYVKAHALINSCLARDGDVSQWHPKIYSIEDEFYQGHHALTESQHLIMTKDLKKQLLTLRTRVSESLKPLHDETDKLNIENEDSQENQQAITKMKEIIFKVSDASTQGMLDLSATVIRESERIVSSDPPPSSYCAVALGSLARGEATPYSDLEYIFLISDEDNKEYFKKLAVDTYFRINNFGETPLKCMYLEEVHDNYGKEEEKRWFFEDTLTNGFKIDGFTPRAGNIPTGNGITPDCPFIQTPAGLLKMYEQCSQMGSGQVHGMINDLTDFLYSTAVIHSHGQGEKLLFKFRKNMNEFSSAKSTQKKAVTLIKDIQTYDFEPSYPDSPWNIPKPVKIKTDICRYPTLLIYNLSMTHNICFTNSWDSLDGLLFQKIISPDYYHDLSFLLASALYIRLSAYLEFKSQKEELSFLPGRTAPIVDRYHIPRQLFIPMCITIMKVKKPGAKPLQQVMRKVEILSIREEFSNAFEVLKEELCSDIFHPDQTMEMIREVTDNSAEMIKYLKLITTLLHRGRYFKTSDDYCTIIMDHLRASRDDTTDTLTWCFYLITMNYRAMGKFKMSNNRLHEAVKMADGWKLDDETSTVPNNLQALIYEQLAENSSLRARYVLAVEYLHKSIALQGGEQTCSSSIAGLLLKIADNHLQQCIFDEVTIYTNRALTMLKVIHGDNCSNSEVAKAIGLLGEVNSRQGKFQLAKKFFVECLDMNKKMHSDNTDHPEIGYVCMCFGQLLEQIGDYEQGIKHCRRSLDIFDKSPFDQGSQFISLTFFVRIYHTLGLCYIGLQQYEQACDHLHKAMELLKTVHGEKGHQELAAVLQVLSEIYYLQNRSDKSLEYAQQSLVMFEHIFGSSGNHPHLVAVHQILGALNISRGAFDIGDGHLRKALSVAVAVYGDTSCHPDMAVTHMSLGVMYSRVGKARQAYAELLKSRSMFEYSFGLHSTHRHLISSKRRLLTISCEEMMKRME